MFKFYYTAPTKSEFVRWYQQRVCAGEINPTFIVFSSEAWFSFHGYTNCQNSKFKVMYYTCSNSMF